MRIKNIELHNFGYALNVFLVLGGSLLALVNARKGGKSGVGMRPYRAVVKAVKRAVDISLCVVGIDHTVRV